MQHMHHLARLLIDSNTTLVKVKWVILFKTSYSVTNSNTTLVKVKWHSERGKLWLEYNSNTTLVKVK